MRIEISKVHYVFATQIKELGERYPMSYSKCKINLVWESYSHNNKGKILA
jgi:hypothetical protein